MRGILPSSTRVRRVRNNSLRRLNAKHDVRLCRNSLYIVPEQGADRNNHPLGSMNYRQSKAIAEVTDLYDRLRNRSPHRGNNNQARNVANIT